MMRIDVLVEKKEFQTVHISLIADQRTPAKRSSVVQCDRDQNDGIAQVKGQKSVYFVYNLNYNR